MSQPNTFSNETPDSEPRKAQHAQDEVEDFSNIQVQAAQRQIQIQIQNLMAIDTDKTPARTGIRSSHASSTKASPRQPTTLIMPSTNPTPHTQTKASAMASQARSSTHRKRRRSMNSLSDGTYSYSSSAANSNPYSSQNNLHRRLASQSSLPSIAQQSLPSTTTSSIASSVRSHMSIYSDPKSRFYQSCVYLPLPDHHVANFPKHLRLLEKEAQDSGGFVWHPSLEVHDVQTDNKEEATSTKEEEDEEEALHRQFCRAVWTIGVQHATPSVLYYGMQSAANFNSTLTMDRVKSHLQKYRQYKSSEEEKFLHEYDQFLGYLQEIEARQKSEGELHLLRLESILGAKAAAHASHTLSQQTARSRKRWKRRQEKSSKAGKDVSSSETEPDEPQNVSMFDQVYSHVLTPEGYGAGRLFLPKMNKDEADSSLGVSLKLVHSLLQHMNKHLSDERTSTKLQYQNILQKQHQTQIAHAIQNNLSSAVSGAIFPRAMAGGNQTAPSVSKMPGHSTSRNLRKAVPQFAKHTVAPRFLEGGSSTSGSDEDSEDLEFREGGNAIDEDDPFFSLLRDMGVEDEKLMSDLFTESLSISKMESSRQGTLPRRKRRKGKTRKEHNDRIQQQTQLVNQVLLEFEESAIESLEMDGIKLGAPIPVVAPQPYGGVDPHPSANSSNFGLSGFSSSNTNSQVNTSNASAFPSLQSTAIRTSRSSSVPSLAQRNTSRLLPIAPTTQFGSNSNENGGTLFNDPTDDSIMKFLEAVALGSRKTPPGASYTKRVGSGKASKARSNRKRKHRTMLDGDAFFWDDSSIESDEEYSTNASGEKIDEYMGEILKLDSTLKGLQSEHMKKSSEPVVTKNLLARSLHSAASSDSEEGSVKTKATQKSFQNTVGSLVLGEDLISLRGTYPHPCNRDKSSANSRVKSQHKRSESNVSTSSFQELMSTLFPES